MRRAACVGKLTKLNYLKSRTGKNGEAGKSRVREKVASIIAVGDTLASKV